MAQQAIDSASAADKSARIINNAFQSQSREFLVQLHSTKLSPQNRGSECLPEESPSKRLCSRSVGIELENGTGSPQPSTKPSDARLKRPSQKSIPLEKRSVRRHTGGKSLEIPPDPPESNTSTATSHIPEALHSTQEVQSASDGVMEIFVAPMEVRAEAGLADSIKATDGPTGGSSIEPNTPKRRRGRPRKPVSERPSEEPNKPKKSRGRPRAVGSNDPTATILPTSHQTHKQGSEVSSPAQVTLGRLDQQPSCIVTPEVTAGAGINAQSGGQIMLPGRWKEAGISEQVDETIPESLDGRPSDSSVRHVDNTTDAHPNALEENHSDDSTESVESSEGDVQAEVLTDPELFNQEHSWRRILKAVRKVSRLTTDSGQSRKKIPIGTRTFRTFVNYVKEVSTYYKSLARHTGSDVEAEQSIESKLKARLNGLCLEVDALEESHAGNKPREMVRDIYAHAIPQMVFLLKDAFITRSPLYSAVENTRTLREVIRLLETTETLCAKARKWSVKPDTELPIVEPTSKVIYPSIRAMVSAFQSELDDRLEAKRRAKLDDDVPKMQLQKEALLQKKREQNERAKERWYQLAAADVQKKLSRQEVPFRPSPQRAPKQDQWSEEEDDALLTMLMNPTIASQPRRMDCFFAAQKLHANAPIVEQRYISALNTPRLQNKLPEHIEQRAMYLKPFMETSFMGDNMPVPDWVSSLHHRQLYIIR